MKENIGEEELYWPFYHVKEDVDIETEIITVSFDKTPLDEKEKKILKNILNEWNWIYLDCGNKILLSKITARDIYAIESLDGELKARLKKQEKGGGNAGAVQFKVDYTDEKKE